MRTIRAWTQQPLAVGRSIELEAGPARHLVRVLRLKAGYGVVLFNGDGNEYPATIEEAGPGDRCRLQVEQAREADTESPLSITLVQAIARGDRMDWCIQKACELGVTSIQPVFTERTEVRLDEKRTDKRLRHWQQVAVAACEQCGRVRVPEIKTPLSLTDLSVTEGLSLFLDPQAERRLPQLDDPSATPVRIVIGPEGGLSEAETRWLARQGFIALRLGPRILRSETAGPAAIAALQARFGDWQ